jgi:cystathionine beta-lyase family protein involved in aluminum resistance
VAEEADEFFIDACAEERGGAASPEGVGFNLGRGDSSLVLDGGGCLAEAGGDVCGRDESCAGAVEGGVQWRGGFVGVSAEV